MRMDFEIKDPVAAKKEIKNRIDLKSWTEKYIKYIKASKRVFGKIYAMKTSIDKKRKDSLEKHERFKEILDLANQNQFAYEPEIVDGIKEKTNEYASELDITDEVYQEKAQQFKKHMQEIKKFRKKKTKKKKGDK